MGEGSTPTLRGSAQDPVRAALARLGVQTTPVLGLVGMALCLGSKG